jgi:hypothetical protein
MAVQGLINVRAAHVQQNSLHTHPQLEHISRTKHLSAVPLLMKFAAGCSGWLQALERMFVSHSELWCSAIEAVAVLDCLMALAGAAQAADGVMCRPKLLDAAADGEHRISRHAVVLAVWHELRLSVLTAVAVDKGYSAG